MRNRGAVLARARVLLGLGSRLFLRPFASRLRQWVKIILLCSVPIAADAANVQYIYDAAGHLVGLIDQNGNPAIYTYDAGGNITSVLTPGASSINVMGFSPASGPAGGAVTITGTGFSATASQDTVKFNGTSAAITSASTTQIVASVPSGATTGPISVTSPAGTATSVQSFTVTPPNGPGPSISGFSPTVGGSGDTVTISGSGFATSASAETVSFNGVVAVVSATSATSITVAVPASAGDGPIIVSTASGSATSASSFTMIPGGYNASDIGAIASDSYGNTVNLTVNNPNDGYLVTFSGNAGDRVSVNVLDSGNMSIANASVFSPNGSLLFGPVGTQTINSGNPINPGFLLGPFILPAAGLYKVLIAPQNGSTGTATITVYHVPPNVTGTLVSGNTYNMALTTPGQTANYTFNGTAGHQALFFFTGSSQPYTEGALAITAPDGTVIFAQGQLTTYPNGSTVSFGPYPLSQTGTYSFTVSPYQSYVFTGSVLFYDDPPNPKVTVTPGGSSATLTTTTPGQTMVFNFSGTAGQRISYSESYSVTGNNCVFNTLNNPDGSTLQHPTACGSPDFEGPYTLPQTGTYSLIVSPGSFATGTVTLTLYNVPPDPVKSLTSGTAVTESVGTPGQSADFTYNGTAGQRISFSESYSVTGNNCIFNVWYNPDGTTLTHPTECGSPAFEGPYSLAQTGTYKLVVSPGSGATGSITVTLYNVPPDPVATLTIGGAGATLTTTTPGQGVDFQFNGTANTSIHFSESYSVTGNNCTFAVLYNPDGSQLKNFGASCGNGGTSPSVTLGQTGTQKLVVTPGSGATGSVTISIASP